MYEAEDYEEPDVVETISWILHNYEFELISAERALSDIAAIIADAENGKDV